MHGWRCFLNGLFQPFSRFGIAMYEKRFAWLHFPNQLRQIALVRMGRKRIRFYITFYGYGCSVFPFPHFPRFLAHAQESL